MENEVNGNSKYKILLVEDDQFDQMAFKRMVKEQNLSYDYTIAGSVSKAKDFLEIDEFDVVIVDHFLGDGTAFDVLEVGKDNPVILATGAGDEELAVKAMKAGACDYLIKDHSRNYLKVLPEIIKNAVKHKKAEEELKKYHDDLEVLVRERTEQLAAEKELLSVTLSSLSDGVVAVDAEKKIMLFNTAARNLTGWKFESVDAKHVEEIFRVIDGKTKKPVESPIDKVLSSGEIATGSDHDMLVGKNGIGCSISATAAPIHKKDGEMIGIVMIFRDVSKEREIDRMKTDFISSVSHELRTPLTSIKAYIETILDDPNMPEGNKTEFLSIIDEESDRLANLIEGLLEISKIESGTLRVIRKPVDIAAVIKHVCSSLQPLVDKKDIRLKTVVSDDLGKFEGDKEKIQSLFANLINNAIKFTPEQGQVSVLVRNQDKELFIRISDTGMGIPKKDLPKIFDRFYRVHRPGTQIQGTGLGLAIVKEIVILHGGRIDIESEENKGTTFTIFLPLAADSMQGLIPVKQNGSAS